MMESHGYGASTVLWPLTFIDRLAMVGVEMWLLLLPTFSIIEAYSEK